MRDYDEELRNLSIGQKVTIRSYSDIASEFHITAGGVDGMPFSIPSSMLNYVGQDTVVTHVDSRRFTVDIDRGAWSWPTQMIEPLEAISVLDTILRYRGYDFSDLPSAYRDRVCTRHSVNSIKDLQDVLENTTEATYTTSYRGLSLGDRTNPIDTQDVQKTAKMLQVSEEDVIDAFREIEWN